MTRARLIRGAFVSVLTALLSIGHLLYSWWLSLRLYQWSGGIHKLPSGWSEFRGAHYAWAIPLELPGALMLRLCQMRTASYCNGTFLAQTSIVLLLLASISTAFLLSSSLVALLTRERISWGRWYWRAIVIALGVAWIPVREDFAAVFQYSVMY